MLIIKYHLFKKKDYYNMILEVIKDVAPLSEGTLVSVAGSFKYDEKQDPFHKLVPTTFEDANFIRLNGKVYIIRLYFKCFMIMFKYSRLNKILV